MLRVAFAFDLEAAGLRAGTAFLAIALILADLVAGLLAFDLEVAMFISLS